MFGKTYGAKLLFVIRRTAIEDAIPVEFGGVISPEHKGLFDRACLRSAREAMKEWRFQRDANGLCVERDPLGVMILHKRLVTEAVENRNAYCHANLRNMSHDQA